MHASKMRILWQEIPNSAHAHMVPFLFHHIYVRFCSAIVQTKQNKLLFTERARNEQTTLLKNVVAREGIPFHTGTVLTVLLSIKRNDRGNMSAVTFPPRLSIIVAFSHFALRRKSEFFSRNERIIPWRVGASQIPGTGQVCLLVSSLFGSEPRRLA